MNTIEHLRERLDLLEEENRQLRAALAPVDLSAPRQWRLTPTEDVVFRRLRRGGPVSRESLELALMNAKPMRMDCFHSNLISVVVYNIRKKLPSNYSISNVWGVGYELITPEISDG